MNPLKDIDWFLDKEKRLPTGELHPFWAWKPATSRFIGEKAVPWDDVQPDGSVIGRDGLEFQEKLSTSLAKLVLAVTATASGKTDWLVQMIATAFIGQDPNFPERKIQTPQIIRVGTEARTIEFIFKQIVQRIPKQFIARETWASGGEGLDGTNGSELRMMSNSLPRTAFQAIRVNKFFLDEEPPSHFFDEVERRMRFPDSQIFCGATTLRGSTFIHDRAERFPLRYRNAQSGPIAWSGAPMFANPYLPKDFIESQKHLYRNDEDMFAICVMGEPRSLSGRHIFAGKALDEMIAHQKKPRFNLVVKANGEVVERDFQDERWDAWELPQIGRKYVMAADLSEGGLGGDFTSVSILCVDTGKMVGKFRGRVEPGPFTFELVAIGRFFQNAIVNFEKNMNGAAVLDRLRQYRYPFVALSENFSGKIQTDIEAYGFRTDLKSKPVIISNLRDAIWDGLIDIPDGQTLDELSRFGWLRSADHGQRQVPKMGAISGHDDCVMSLAIAWHTARSPRARPIRLEQKVSTIEECLREAVENCPPDDRKSRRNLWLPQNLW